MVSSCAFTRSRGTIIEDAGLLLGMGAPDVANAAVDWGTPTQRDLRSVTVAEMRAHAADGQFASGSMGPKVEAALRFVEAGGPRSVITSLDRIGEAMVGVLSSKVRRRSA